MAYFRISLATVQDLARLTNFDVVAAFLVVARHVSSSQISTYQPYTVSGAGVNSVHEKAGISERRARDALDNLQDLGVLRAVPPAVRAKHRHARWEVAQGSLDLCLPHAFVDPINGFGATSILHRINAVPEVVESEMISDNVGLGNARLDALMLTLAIYSATRMQKSGGIQPTSICRDWEVTNVVQHSRGFKWHANPTSEPMRVSDYFIADALAYRVNQLPTSEEDRSFEKIVQIAQLLMPSFWRAWAHIVAVGICYEAISIFNMELDIPFSELVATLRINDFHAGAYEKKGDPSLMRSFASSSRPNFAFYMSPNNFRDESEWVQVVMPYSEGFLGGIYRPRFRCATKDTGTWLEREKANIGQLMDQLGLTDALVGSI